MLFSLKSGRFHVQSKFSWSFAKCIHYSCECGQTLSSELLRKDIIIIIRKCLLEVFVVHCVPESNMNFKITRLNLWNRLYITSIRKAIPSICVELENFPAAFVLAKLELGTFNMGQHQKGILFGPLEK